MLFRLVPVGLGGLAWLILVGSITVAGQAPRPPAPGEVINSNSSDSDRRTAADLFRQAMQIEDPSEEKVGLLTRATTLDPTVPTYFSVLQSAKQAVLLKKQGDAKEQEQRENDRKQAQAAGAAGALAQDKLDEAFASRRKGNLDEARQSAEEAGALARNAGNPQLAEQSARLLAAIDGDADVRRKVLGGLLAAVAMAGMVAVALLRKRTRRLEMVEGPEPGRVYKLDKDKTTIGAVDTDADIVIPDEFRNISRRHCQVARSGRHFFLVDCSRNGTFVNGRAVPKNKPVLLRTNDEITLSDSVILIYR